MSIDSVMSRMSALENMMSSLGGRTASGVLGSSALPAASATDASSTAAGAGATSSAEFAQALAAAGLGTSVTPAAPASQTPPASGASGAALVDSASKYLGVPYVWGGETAAGMDCSGLVQRAFADLGVDMPRTAREQMREGTAVASIDDALPGDLIVFDGGAHIGIYVGDNRMIHAPKPGKVVQEAAVYEKPTAIRRIAPPTTAPMTAAPTAPTMDALSSAVSTADVQRLALQMLTGSAA